MIISASRRTDIPAYYSEWFTGRIKEKHVLVRNPLNLHHISRIDLSPNAVDCIVFWTKNPQPMLGRLHELSDYNYYFQYTLTSYGKDIEINLPSKSILIDSFKRLSDMIGPERVVWRYDPILINGKYSIDYHEKHFDMIAGKLKGYTEKCTISFIDFYSKISKNVKELGITETTDNEKREIASKLSRIAFSYGLNMDTCAEEIELGDLGITHARCIDDRLISRITGVPVKAEKDKNQRPACGCAASTDIGLYNTCLNGCRYCYANSNHNTVMENIKQYDMHSPLLCSRLGKDDIIYEKPGKSLRRDQLSFFE